jgi:VRR-NUC domain
MCLVGLGDTVLNSEHLEQVRLVSWFRRSYPDVKIFAIPNGGGRSMAQGASLKAEGVSPGVPDLFVPAWGMWIEMKRETGGALSPVQRDWIAYLDDCGYQCIVGRGFEDAKRQIEIIKPL